MLNVCTLTGRLVKEVDLRYTQNGKAVGSFTLAVDRQFKNAQGEKETDFINAVIWGKSAEALANYTRKGSLIGITGRIQTRNYENQQGQRVYVTEVVAENFTFLESKNSQGNQQENRSQSNSRPNQNNQQGFSTKEMYGQEDPFLSSGESINISDDDMPF